MTKKVKRSLVGDKEDPFHSCTKTTKSKYGTRVECIKGVWEVESSNPFKAELDARTQFVQHYRDGVYDDIEQENQS